MERGLFSPLGTPTPLGSMGFGANLDTPEPGDTDLSSMDAHLRSIEAYEHTKLEQSVNDMVSALQNESLEEMWPDASIELNNLVQGVHHYAPSPVASPPRPSLPRQEEKYSPHKEEEEQHQEEEEEHPDRDDDPLADICTLLQAAGDRGVDLNRWLNHYDKTGTGVLRRQDLHRAVTSLGLGVSVGESEYDEQTAERALSQRSFDSLVEYLGAPSNSDIVPYARLLTMVPSLMETRRGDIRSPTRPSGRRGGAATGNRVTNEQNSPNRGNVLLHNTKPLSATSPGGLAWTLEQGQTKTPADAARARVRSAQKKKRQLLQLQKTKTKEGLPMDVQATLGQQRARERVRERVRLEKLKVKKEKKKKLQVIKNKQKVKCDTVTLTGKMRKVSAKRKQKKTKKAAKQAAKLLEIANATSLDDLLRSKLTSRTTFGHLLNSIKKITTPNGVTQDRVSITTMGLTTLLQDVIGLKLPLKSSEQLMKNILLLAQQEGLDMKDEEEGEEEETETKRTKGGASSSSTLAVMRAPTLACEKYFRRVRCEHRIDYGGWYQNKTNAYDKDMKRLRKTVQQCLKGDVVALGALKVEATLLEKNARLVLGEDPKAVADAMGESAEDVHGSSSGSGGTKPTRRTTRMRKELRTHHILPQWQVLAEAERITSTWLLSLEGRAAVRHAAWAAINRGKPMDAAVEPDAGALASAGKTLRGQRLTKLLDSKDGHHEDGGTEGGARGGGSPFYEMLSHKLFGEYLRETLVSAEEWKKTKMKMNSSGGGRVGSFPRRPFSEWLEKRSEQEKRNRETVEQWRKHKRRQFGEKLIQTKKIASVDAVLSQLSALEQAGYQEVAEKSGFGKMRKSARQGIHFLEKKKRIKEMGQVNAMGAAREEQANHNNNSRRVHPIAISPTTGTTGLWISFEQFLSVMETSLFSLKAHAATKEMADCLLMGLVWDGCSASNSSNNAPLFVEDPELKVGNKIPTVVVAEEKAKLATEEQERRQVYEAWLTSKDEAKRAKAEQNKKLKKKSIHNKKVMKQKSNKAVNQWNKTRKARKVTKRFRQQKAWEDVVAPANEVDLDVDDM